MSIDIQKLKALAENAIEQHDRWVAAGEPWPMWNVRLLEMQAAANPGAVLELIAEIESANARLHEVATACATAEQERDKLKAENESLIAGMNEILRVTPMGVEAFGIAALVIGELCVIQEEQS
jgi:hypothetical protein